MKHTIILEPHQDAFVQSRVEAGQYGSATDVIDARIHRSLVQAESGGDLDLDGVCDRLDRRLEEMEQRRSA